MWSHVGLRKHHYKASGGDGIPVELFQILKDDAVKVQYASKFGKFWISLVAQAVKCLSTCGRPGIDPWVGKIPWRRKCQPTPVLLPGKFHGRGSRLGCSPWGQYESDTTEWLHFHFLWKTQHWPQGWKRSVFVPIPKKERQCQRMLKLPHNCTYLTH